MVLSCSELGTDLISPLFLCVTSMAATFSVKKRAFMLQRSSECWISLISRPWNGVFCTILLQFPWFFKLSSHKTTVFTELTAHTRTFPYATLRHEMVTVSSIKSDLFCPVAPYTSDKNMETETKTIAAEFSAHSWN